MEKNYTCNLIVATAVADRQTLDCVLFANIIQIVIGWLGPVGTVLLRRLLVRGRCRCDAMHGDDYHLDGVSSNSGWRAFDL